MDPVTGLLIAGGGFLTWVTAIFGYVVYRNSKEAANPRQVLEMRLVQGEIDEAEYRRLLSLLTYGPPLPTELPVPEDDIVAGLPQPRRPDA